MLLHDRDNSQIANPLLSFQVQRKYANFKVYVFLKYILPSYSSV